MSRIHLLIIAIYCQYYMVQCVIPNLEVNKLNRKVIERKRQDNLDMCRIFTAENEKLILDNRFNSLSQNKHGLKSKSRVKRSIATTKSNAEVQNRIEDIVEKMYEDFEEDGTKATGYRQKSVNTLKITTPVSIADLYNNGTGRRFDFAPAMLAGSVSTTESPIPQDGAIKIPWHKKWKHGIIPYFIDSKTYDSHLAEIITKAFDYFEKATCIRLQRLRERPTDKLSLQGADWLYITNPSGIRQCVHTNDRKKNEGVQMIVFGYDCLLLGEIVHEVMHILGFPHEHIRPNRDQHISINWLNVKPGYKKYFLVNSDEAAKTLSYFPYDYASVMHYPSKAFSKNGQPTIVVTGDVKVGQRQGLSETDVAKVGMIFGAECFDRNKQYLLNTCPSVVKAGEVEKEEVVASEDQIEEYFKNRLWPYGIVNFKIKDKLQFSAEERDNINAVIRHIEKETCIEFRDLSPVDEDSDENQERGNRDDGKATNENQNEIDIDNINDKVQTKVNKSTIYFNEDDILSTDNKSTINSNEHNDEKSIENKSTNYINELKNKSTIYFNEDDDDAKSEDKETNRRVYRTDTRHAFSRRHSDNVIELTRSDGVGCKCPEPGKPGGSKTLKINGDCFNSVNDLLHLFVHVLGLDHQHNMHDRDSYLHILWDNINEDVRQEMQNVLPSAASAGFPYDYQSVMHYPWLQIKDGVTNIMYPIWNDGWAMGHWQGLSSTDVQKINLIYSKQCTRRNKEANSKTFL